MSPKNNPRNWNDVQTAIATVAIVTTLGMWNLFAAPAPKKATQAQVIQPPMEDNPLPSFTNSTPTAIPQVKIFFTTQTAPRQSVVSQPQQQTLTRKQREKNNNNGDGGGGTVTTTRTS